MCVCVCIYIYIYIYAHIYIVDSTNLSGKKLYRQVGVERVMTPVSLDGIMVNALAQNGRDIGLIPTLGAIFPIFTTPTTLVDVTVILYKLYTVWLLNLPCVLCR